VPAVRLVTLTHLFIYPVKSCRGLALDQAVLTARGLEHDREWMIVDADGNFLTQRQHPRLALIETELTGQTLRLRVPGQAPLEVPLALRPGPRRRVRVWRHECEALDEGGAAAEWLQAFLGQPVRLVRFDPGHRRLSNPEWTGGLEAENRFSDGYPLLVLSEESLEELNRRIGAVSPLPLDRFRPNLVLRGAGPHAEDVARALKTPDVELRPVKPCVRCRITATDQRTAAVGREPLRTLATYRHDERLGGVTFGVNAIVLAGAGKTLRRGMTFRIE
jgi:uncharacterized protein YcbX